MKWARRLFSATWVVFAAAWMLGVATLFALNLFTSAVSMATVGASRMLASAGVQTPFMREAVAMQARKAAVHRTTERVAKRTAIGASRNVSAIAAESAPYVGIAAIIGFTAWELRDACETMKDMAALEQIFDDKTGDLSEETARVCGIETPTVATVKADLTAGSSAAWESMRELGSGMAEGASTFASDFDWQRLNPKDWASRLGFGRNGEDEETPE